MPVSAALNGPIVEITAEGSYELEDLMDAIRSAYAEDGAPAEPLLLVDGRASGIQYTKEDVQARLSAIDAWPADRLARRTALVVSSSRNNDLARFYQFYAQGRKGARIEVFQDPDEARRWLKSDGNGAP